MGKGTPYSHDLRARIIYFMNKYSCGPKVAGQAFDVHRRTIQNYITYMKLRGNTRSFAQTYGRKPRAKSYTSSDLRALILILSRIRGLTVWQMQNYLFVAVDKFFRRSTVIRMLRAILHSYKRCTVRAIEGDTIAIALHYIGLIGCDINTLYFGDETHISSKNGVQHYAWSWIGEQAIVDDLFVRHFRSSIIGIIGVNGLVSHCIKSGSINANSFRYFITFFAVGILPVGSTLCLDNASIHKNNITVSILGYAGIRVWWLPPYSPQCNPIEILWRSMKATMRGRRMAALTRANPTQSADIVLNRYYNTSLLHLYNQCGYY
eukprot:224574_1